jgi:hypothetical protein
MSRTRIIRAISLSAVVAGCPLACSKEKGVVAVDVQTVSDDPEDESSSEPPQGMVLPSPTILPSPTTPLQPMPATSSSVTAPTATPSVCEPGESCDEETSADETSGSSTTPTDSPSTEPSEDPSTTAEPSMTPEPSPAPTTPAGQCTTATLNPCSAPIPRFNGTQMVDGNADDFCDVPITTLSLASAALSIGNTAGTPHRADIRVAWSETALHVHAAVTDPNVLVQAPNDSWSGDSLDVYIAASGNVTGSLSLDDAWQVILAPPSTDGSIAASAMRYPAIEAISSGFANTLTDDGYAVELLLPWPGGAVLASGAAVMLNFALNVREQACDGTDLNSCRQYYGAFFAGAAGSPSDCDNYTLLSGRSAEPWCDDRTWCPTTLE